MAAYADTSFLVRLYTPHPNSGVAITWMQNTSEPLPFTALQRHEVRTAIRLRVFRREITAHERAEAYRQIESDLNDKILAHTVTPWTDAFREAENLSALHVETFGTRSSDLFHVGLAVALGAAEFLTFDTRQAALARAAGLRVRP